MLKCFSKIFTGVLAVSCLSVAALNLRLHMSTSSSLELTIPSFKNIPQLVEKNSPFERKITRQLAQINFSELEKRVHAVAVNQTPVEKFAPLKQQENKVLAKTLINFDEPVKLSKITIEYSLPTNLISLIPDFNFVPQVMLAQETVKEVKEDSISTTMAAAEPEFFEYEIADKKVTDKTVNKTELAEEIAPQAKTLTKTDYEQIADDFISFDYSTEITAAVKDQAQTVANSKITKTSKLAASKTIKASTFKNASLSAAVTTQNEEAVQGPEQKSSNALATHSSQAQSVVMSIHARASNLKTNKSVKNFEVRFQDDQAEIYEDFGAGQVKLATHIEGIMNRSMVLLKRGYAPTNTDLIIEANSKVTIPLIEEDVFNMLLDKYSKTAAQGALLIELDEDTETAQVDTEYGEEILLDAELRKTNTENYRYKLLMGVNAGNIYLTYKHFDGTETSKIVHIHEREVTFDANLYEEVKHKQVALYEEGLLSRELSALNIKGDQVRVFGTAKVSHKLNQNTYKLLKKRALLGERQYLEVNHLSEPIFVGYRDNNKLIIPSEGFIQFVLSKFEDRKLGNRCIIQVNLNDAVASFQLGTESAGSNLMTSSQILDQDGKFYDSVGPKSNKIIIMGENHGSLDQAQDGKVNIKINYLNGSSRFVTSYCSPNTYLVEQL